MATSAQLTPSLEEDGLIHWPPAYQPESSPGFLRNEILAAAPLPVVWAWLVRAGDWPLWYMQAADIHFLSHTGPVLRNRSRFRWKTARLRITCKVLEFEPPLDGVTPARLAWNGRAIGFDAWHAWLLTPMSDGSTHILSEEVRHGWLARLNLWLLPGRTQARQQLWLEALARQAANGPPASP